MNFEVSRYLKNFFRSSHPLMIPAGFLVSTGLRLGFRQILTLFVPVLPLWNHSDEPTDFSVKKYEPHWENLPDWNEYLKLCRAIWNDLRYFPVATSSDCPDYTVTFENSWQYERTYGGKRRHEGIDIMASVNQRGIYPIVSMTDGTIQNLGWLELGGYRIESLLPEVLIFIMHILIPMLLLQKGSRFMPEISLGIWAIPDTVKLKEQPAGFRSTYTSGFT